MNEERRAYIVGGGIAGLAAATLLIRDGGFRGEQVLVLEQSAVIGGSLDGSGDAEAGYVIRGGRMFEEHFGCTFDLFSHVPTLDDPKQSVTEEILAFTAQVVTSSRCRLVRGGQRIEAPPLRLRLRDKWDLIRLSLRPESSIGRDTIEDYFSAPFFDSNFWFMWCSMFAFQPWHSLIEFRRYMHRFIHLLPGFNRLEGIHRTKFNQYDSLIAPLSDWLRRQGAQIVLGASVKRLHFDQSAKPSALTSIEVEWTDLPETVEVREQDFVFVTLGSMTEGSALGGMATPAELKIDSDSGSWALWRSIAQQADHFGRPDVFSGQVGRTIWQSFTVTLKDPIFFEFMERFTGNPAGTGGLVTFRDSSWLLSVVLAFQPHFANQPPEINVFWGYALHPDRVGDRVRKRMLDCTGAEILEELFHHLPIGEAGSHVIKNANCVPCVMPFITSQFMPRAAGDRPAVIPAGARNFAFLGQYCEVPEDTVFTVEYSIRTAQTAVYGLLDLPKQVTPIYRGYLSPAVALRAALALS